MPGPRHALLVLAALAAALTTLALAAPAPAQETDAPAAEQMQTEPVSRFGSDPDGDGRINGLDGGLPVEIGLHPVFVAPPAEVCADSGAARWRIDDRPAAVRGVERQQGECKVLLAVRGPGVHRIEVSIGGGAPIGTAEFEVDDRLIVGLGDSVASGEGNPISGEWEERACHLSPLAGFQQGVQRLADVDDHTSITFVSLACSGATIDTGLLGPYRGIEPQQDAATHRPQVTTLRALAAANGGHVDAVLLSIGANDVGFSDVVKACAGPGDCAKTEAGPLPAKLGRLADGYDRLAPELAAAAPGAPVLITEYFDPTRDEEGEFCGASLAFTSRSEAQWAYERLLRPLNATVRAAAAREGWDYVGGIADEFATHGYCSPESVRWIRRLTESFSGQGGLSGTMHPNERGHAAIGVLTAAELGPELGITPPPKSKEEKDDSGTALWKYLLAAAVALLLLVLTIKFNGIARLWRLFTKARKADPIATDPRQDAAKLPRASSLGWALLALVGVLAALALFAGVIGKAVLGVRFLALGLPAEQALSGVTGDESWSVGAQGLAFFAAFGALALVGLWLIDSRGTAARGTRRGILAIGLLELAVAIWLGEFGTRRALLIFGGFVLAGLLLHLIVDRWLLVRERRGYAARAGRDVKTLRTRVRQLLWPREPGLGWRLWRLVGLLVLIGAVALTFHFEGADRWMAALAAIAVAAIFFVAGGLATPAVSDGEDIAVYDDGLRLEIARVAMASAGVFCMASLVFQDEPWLGFMALIAIGLGLACIAVAKASGDRFLPVGIAALVSVTVFGAAALILRGWDAPKAEPVAIVLDDGSAACGVYIGNDDGKLWVGQIEVPEVGSHRRPDSDSGSIESFDSDTVAHYTVGSLIAGTQVEERAADLRDELVRESGDADAARAGAPGSCSAPEPEPAYAETPARRIAERFQPTVLTDRGDGFWPVPVTSLFDIEDRRAGVCRQAVPGSGGCFRVESTGDLPWAGGDGEVLDYPANNHSKSDQHEELVEALGSADPARSAAEYFLLAGDLDDNRPDTLQYWFFYPFNYQPLFRTVDYGGFHEGDFEAVQILLSAKTHEPRFVFMNRHAGGRRFAWDDPALTIEDDHLRVFAARGSHASYENCNPQLRREPRAPDGLLDDKPACPGKAALEIPYTTTPLIDLSRVGWACWEGGFGEADTNFENSISLADIGPQSPLYQQDDGSTPCDGIEDPGSRDGPDEEVLDAASGIPARIAAGAGSIEATLDDCADWYEPDTSGTYLIACSEEDLDAYFAGGLEQMPDTTVRIDDLTLEDPAIGGRTVPALRQNHEGDSFEDLRIVSERAAEVSVFAACPEGANRTVAAVFPKIELQPNVPLEVSDADRERWRLLEPDGRVVAEAAPFVRSGRPETGGSACQAP